MNRLYAVEATPTLTGADGRPRLPMASAGSALALDWPSHSARRRARATPSRPVLKRLRGGGRRLAARIRGGAADRWRARRSRRRCMRWPTLINQALGNVGQTVDYIEPIEPGRPAEPARLLAAAMTPGRVEAADPRGNPVYDAPAELDFGERLAKVRQQRPSRPLRRRDRGALHTGIFRGRIPGGLVRRPRLRRHRQHGAAGDRAAVRRPLRP